MAGIEEVLALARKVQSNAHAPYSGFRVGAVLEAEDGSLHVGCNVENASLGLTLCTERGAMAAAVAPDVPIVSEASGKRSEWRLGELLPIPFELSIEEVRELGSDDE